MPSDQTKEGLRLVKPDSVNFYEYDGKYKGLIIPDIKKGIAIFIIGPFLTVVGHAILNEHTGWGDDSSDFAPSTRVRSAHVTEEAIKLYRKHALDEGGIPKVYLFTMVDEDEEIHVPSSAETLALRMLKAESGCDPNLRFYGDRQYWNDSKVFIKTNDGSVGNCRVSLCGDEILGTTVCFKIPVDWVKPS